MVFKLRQHLIAVLVLLVLFETVICQKRRDDRKKGLKPKPKPKPRPRQRGRPVPEEPTIQRVNCYYCSVNFFTTKFDVNNLCYNPAKNFTAADSEYLITCATPTKFCTADILRVGGGIVSIDRKCGGATCNYFCISKGYGVDLSTCTFCCPSKPIIDVELLEEGETVPEYRCPEV